MNNRHLLQLLCIKLPWQWRVGRMSISLCWRRSCCSSWASARRTSPGARWWPGRGWCTSRPRARCKIQYRYLGLYLQFPTGDPWHMYCGMCLFVCVHGSSSRLITNVEGHENTRLCCVTKLYLCETVIITVFIFGQLFTVNLIYCGNLANKITRN